MPYLAYPSSTPDPDQPDHLAQVSPSRPILHDETGDLAAELNQACRSFADANQLLVRELRLAAQSDEAQSLFLHGTSQALRPPAGDCRVPSLRETGMNTAQVEDIAVIESATHR